MVGVEVWRPRPRGASAEADARRLACISVQGVRAVSKVEGKDAGHTCAACGITSAMAGGLKKCTKCNKARYCCRDCQVRLGAGCRILSAVRA